MILMYDKTFDDLVHEAEEQLNYNNFSTTPGSIAKLFLNIVNKIEASFYSTLRLNHMQSFLSSATGTYLDDIGMILNCKRYPDEEDDFFRDRVSKQILYTAKANEMAIRLAALSVNGVDNIVVNKYSYGNGSFSIYIINDKTKTDSELIKDVYDAVNEVVSFGTKFTVNTPKNIETSLKIKLMFKNNVTDSKMQEIRMLVKNNVKNYLTSRGIGEALIANEISKIIMSASESILNFAVSEFKISNILVNFKDQTARKNERFILSSKQDDLIVN